MKFDLIVIGAHTGFWLKDEINKTKGKKLLVEPVPYNLLELKENTKNIQNIFIEESAISDKDEKKLFYSIKRSSIDKLKKHWASGIGSFDKKHLLNHKSKRFDVSDVDIDEISINCLSFNSLLLKYGITSVNKLIMDVEGYEYDLLKSIDYSSIEIKKILFEKKHFDGTFKEGKKLEEIINLLEKQGYKIKKIDTENLEAVKTIFG